MPLVAAIDQGTSSSRVILFDSDSSVLVCAQEEVQQHNALPGWSDMSPVGINESINRCIKTVADSPLVTKIGRTVHAIGITNQRETTVCWDKNTGMALCKAVVWLDTRTRDLVAELIARTPSQSKHHFQHICGLPISTYFSAVKLRWLIDNDHNVKHSHDAGTLMFGTVDSWIIYNLTGGVDGGIHTTDVTNASRTMLMNLQTLAWDPEMIEFFGFEKVNLPTIRSSSEIYGYVKSGPFAGIPISGCLGDQQAALLGQRCVNPGDLKNTYGTGCFMLFNTGTEVVIPSVECGLLTTVGYQLGSQAPVYALEGSIAVAGAAVRWLRDNLNLVRDPQEVSEFAAQEDNTGGVYFVPAFSGLFAPYWRDDARGCLVGLTQYTNKSHICRATLESVCWQTKEIVDMMNKASQTTPLKTLRVDGGLTASEVCMQLQADILNIPVIRPSMAETTAFGAAIAAGLAVGSWSHEDVFGEKALNGDVTVYQSAIGEEERVERYGEWKKAVKKSFGSI
ncbi:hypothetical protein HDU98_004169 [Podochytrium sp. JEL0797]|nr:hypothetical protein HDU98_004169 [Podochytrium sp. JEL0797]